MAALKGDMRTFIQMFEDLLDIFSHDKEIPKRTNDKGEEGGNPVQLILEEQNKKAKDLQNIARKCLILLVRDGRP